MPANMSPFALPEPSNAAEIVRAQVAEYLAGAPNPPAPHRSMSEADCAAIFAERARRMAAARGA